MPQPYSRSRNGCYTCKGRKKKCDEVKPQCSGCRRNFLPCNWLSPRPAIDDRGSKSPPAADLQEPAVQIERHERLEVSPAVPLPSSRAKSPSLMTPQSVILLQHYLRETADCIAMTPLNDNPFVTILLPLAYTNDLLMHALLVVSGAHLTYREPGNLNLQIASASHYSHLVSGTRLEIAHLDDQDVESMQRLLRVLLLMCHYESISGDTQGNIVKHLEIMRHLIDRILPFHNTVNAGVDEESFGFAIEVYNYLICCNTLTPTGLATKRQLPSDTIRDGYFESSTFGIMFAGSHELYRLIPLVSQLAALRLSEEPSTLEASCGLLLMYEGILAQVNSWNLPDLVRPNESPQDHELRRHAADTLRHGLHIYLEAAIAGSWVDKQSRDRMESHMRQMFTHTRVLMASRQYVASMLWPVMIAGSCITKQPAQEVLLAALRDGFFQMRQLEVIAQLLTLLWEDSDPRSYGPYGLYLTMEKHGINLSNA